MKTIIVEAKASRMNAFRTQVVGAILFVEEI
jgi:hypothetical protein